MDTQEKRIADLTEALKLGHESVRGLFEILGSLKSLEMSKADEGRMLAMAQKYEKVFSDYADKNVEKLLNPL